MEKNGVDLAPFLLSHHFFSCRWHKCESFLLTPKVPKEEEIFRIRDFYIGFNGEIKRKKSWERSSDCQDLLFKTGGIIQREYWNNDFSNFIVSLYLEFR